MVMDSLTVTPKNTKSENGELPPDTKNNSENSQLPESPSKTRTKKRQSRRLKQKLNLLNITNSPDFKEQNQSTSE